MIRAGGKPFDDGITLFESRRILGFRQQAVVRKYDRRLRADGKLPDQTVVGVRVAEYPPGPVNVHDDGQGRLRLPWPQDFYEHLSALASVNQLIFDLD